MGFAAVALHEDVFSLNDAFFRRNGLDALCLFTEPGNRNGGKGSTKESNLEFDALLGPNSRGKWMFNLGHLGHEIRRFDQLRWGVPPGHYNV